MIFYWVLFLIPSFFSFIGQARVSRNKNGFHSNTLDVLWVLILLLLTFIIGLRVEVGGDWFAYIRMFNMVVSLDHSQSFGSFPILAGDPGFLLINWLSHRLELGIYGVNFICGFIFSTGLILFCRSLPRPFLALAVAVPYMIIVVGMGYTRQALALGLVMIALVAISRDKKFLFLFWVLCAVPFHKSAIIMIPIAALATSKNRVQSIFLTAIIISIAYFNFLADPFEELYRNYILAQDAQSQGALIRVLMNIMPSLIYLIWPHRFKLQDTEHGVWKIMAYISIGLLLMLIIFPDISTAIDRVALYMLPIQLVIFSHLPEIFGNTKAISKIITFLILFYYSIVLFIWLNFAIHAGGWLPYRNLFFDF